MTRCIALLAVLCAQILLISCESCSLLESEEGTSVLYVAGSLERSVVLPTVWRVITLNDVIEVASCGPGLNCRNSFPSEFNATIQSDDSQSTSLVSVSLNITSLNRTMRGLQIAFNSYATVVCEFRIFTRPVNLTCSRPEIENDFIKVTCTSADQVLPNPVCLFNYLPEYPPLQYNVIYDDSLRTCTLTGRPKSFTPQADYSFQLQMYPNVTHGQNYSVSTDGWTPPLTVQMVSFTANNQHTSLEVKNGSDVNLVCTLNSDTLYTLELLRADSVTTIGTQQNIVMQVIKADPNLSGTEYSCRVMNYEFGEFSDVGILGDSLKIYVKSPLQLASTTQNNTVYYIRSYDIRLKFSVWGYPRPSHPYIVYRGSSMSSWQIENTFTVVQSDIPDTIPPIYEITVNIRYDNVRTSATYALYVTNGEGHDALWIHFTFEDRMTTVFTTTTTMRWPFEWTSTSTTTSTTLSLSSWGVQPYMWAPPVASAVVFLLIIFLVILIRRAKMWRKQEQRVSRRHPSVLPSLSHSSRRRTGAYREQPVRAGPNVYFTNASGGRVTCDPPPYEELPAVAVNLGGTHDSTDTTFGHDMQQIVTPPPYDTVCKPGDLPPPYTDFSE